MAPASFDLAGFKFEPPLAEQRSGGWRAAAKGSIGFVIVATAASRIDEIIEPLGDVRIKDVATLLERFEAIGVENFRPEIAVIGGRIAARKNMLEVRRSVTHADRVGHADPREFLAFERDDVDLIGEGSRCSFRSTSAEAVYSTVAQP